MLNDELVEVPEVLEVVGVADTVEAIEVSELVELVEGGGADVETGGPTSGVTVELAISELDIGMIVPTTLSVELGTGDGVEVGAAVVTEAEF